MGHLDPPHIDVDAVQARLDTPEFAPVMESLREIGVNSAVEMFATYMGTRADFAPWLQGAEINRDRDLRLQYLGGWGINSNLADPIYREMLAYRRLAGHPFVGSPERVERLLGYLAANAAQ
jgi:spermidine synthase